MDQQNNVRMFIKTARRFALTSSIALMVLLASCASTASSQKQGSTTTTQIPVASTSIDTVALDMLKNIQANGFDKNSSVNNGLGGLWVNWRYGTNPLQVNMNGTGVPDGASVNPPRHDPLTDIRYLHNLYLYKNLHPGDTQFDKDIQAFLAIVKNEFTNSRNERGWLYDELIDIYHLSQDPFFQQAAKDLATNYSTELQNSKAPVLIKVNSTHPNGYYRVDYALEQGTALVMAGTTFQNATWISQGQNLIQFVFSHAYDPSLHILFFEMDNVLNADGSVNANETFYRDVYGHTKVDGSIVRLGSTALEILSLLHSYLVSNDKQYLTDATNMIAPFTATQNSLGLWDSQYLGYFEAITFKGNSVANAGEMVLGKGKKESGRQLQMLEVFRILNTVTNNAYQSMQDLMLQITLQKAYYATGHGVLYEVRPDWTPVVYKNGVAEDWVTTEAMGVALEGLFSIEEQHPW